MRIRQTLFGSQGECVIIFFHIAEVFNSDHHMPVDVPGIWEVILEQLVPKLQNNPILHFDPEQVASGICMEPLNPNCMKITHGSVHVMAIFVFEETKAPSTILKDGRHHFERKPFLGVLLADVSLLW